MACKNILYKNNWCNGGVIPPAGRVDKAAASVKPPCPYLMAGTPYLRSMCRFGKKEEDKDEQNRDT